MSDSELSIRSRSPSPLPKKKSTKHNKNIDASSSWCEIDRATPQPQPSPRRKTSAASTSESAGKRRKTTTSASKKIGTDIFQIINQEEKCAPASSAKSTTSSFGSRVSSGTSRRTAVRSGDFFIDLKIYKIEDVQNETDPLERYKKALVTVRLQCETKSVEWEKAQAFLGTAYEIFKDSETTYFQNTVKK
ncbi:uncharacterized protein LOC134744492 [Cydia strobilella]|uniref:uncharacterized protein LOC134744492 n=1 Tax=Cydia strobilella TaxID=1100964 RepID=UPI003006794B